jgi:hypothetical protein
LIVHPTVWRISQTARSDPPSTQLDRCGTKCLRDQEKRIGVEHPLSGITVIEIGTGVAARYSKLGY